MKAQDLHEKSRTLQSEAKTLIQQIGESRDYWQTRTLEAERWLLRKNVEELQNDIMKDVENRRLTVPNSNNIFLEAGQVEKRDFKFRIVKQYFFFTRIRENRRKDRLTVESMAKKGFKYLPVGLFKRKVEELKQEIMDGKKDSLLRDRAEEVLYNMFASAYSLDIIFPPRKKRVSSPGAYGYRRVS